MNQTPDKTSPVPPTAPITTSQPGGSWPENHAPGVKRPSLMRHLRSTFIAGMLTAIPIFVTVYLISIVYSLVTTYTQTPANWLVARVLDLLGMTGDTRSKAVGEYLVGPLIALAISLLIVYILGLLGAFVIGRRLLAVGEHFLSNLPLIKGIYGTTKQVMSAFRQGGSSQSFQRVVLVEFPRLGTWTVGFVTKTITDTARNQKFTCVFIPMTPNPTSGFFQMFPEESVRETGWTVDQGIKIVLSGGLLAPDQLPFGEAPNHPTPPNA